MQDEKKNHGTSSCNCPYLIMPNGSEISWWWRKHPRISILRLDPMAEIQI
jgi:hypothetical protein